MVQRAENPASRARATFVAAFACLLAGLALVAWPGNADSAPARVLVLGQTAETPPPTCPGKIVNGVEVIPCRVEGHVTGFQAMAGGVAAPYEAPFDGKVVAWSITLARPSKTETKTTTDEIAYFNDFLGRPSEARIGVLRPVEGSKPPQVHARPPEPAADPQPLLRRQGDLRPRASADRAPGARSSPSRSPPGRRCSPSTSPAKTPGAAAACRTTAPSSADIQAGHPQQGVGKTKTYGCYYSNARLLYTATLVKAP